MPSLHLPYPHWRVGGGQIRDVVESLISRIWSTIEGVELSLPFPVLTYHEAMTRVSFYPLGNRHIFMCPSLVLISLTRVLAWR